MYETRSFAVEPRNAIHPKTGKPIKVVGVDTSTEPPTLIALVTGPSGTHVERLPQVGNDRR